MVLFTWAHRLAILLLPILAGLLALVYVGRRRQFYLYDHLIVAMQFLSFEFLIFAVAWMIPDPVRGWALLIATLWTPVNLLVQLLEHGGDVDELVEHAKLEMFLDQVFVFTPKGELISLPRGAMPLDFAYALHTNIGDTAAGVKINGELRPLRATLQNGDVVEIVRGPKPVVPPDWQSLAITGRARSAIRRHLRHHERDEFVRLGKIAIEETFQRAGKALSGLSLRPALDRFAAAGEDDLQEMVGRGVVAAAQVLDAVFPGLQDSERAAASARRRIEDGKAARLYVRGGGLGANASLRFAECCTPVPGDRIVGIREPGKDVIVHTIDCAHLAEFEDREDVWCDLHWTPEAERHTISQGRLRATIRDAPGVLGQVCTIIGDAGGNIVNLRMHHRQADFFEVDLDLEVVDARHLTHMAAAPARLPLGRGRGAGQGLSHFDPLIPAKAGEFELPRSDLHRRPLRHQNAVCFRSRKTRATGLPRSPPPAKEPARCLRSPPETGPRSTTRTGGPARRWCSATAGR
ncbi:MAG: RelA/SpoT AH/RIS domain-containing protein [Caulobacteraceae bacterium]